jgi:hypothetical protein
VSAKRAPAPIGVVTGARLFLLRQVLAGRVRWMTESSEALLFGDSGRPVDVTGLWMELVRSGWARVIPWDMAEPTPPAAETKPTPAGEDVLAEANRGKTKK